MISLTIRSRDHNGNWPHWSKWLLEIVWNNQSMEFPPWFNIINLYLSMHLAFLSLLCYKKLIQDKWRNWIYRLFMSSIGSENLLKVVGAIRIPEYFSQSRDFENKKAWRPNQLYWLFWAISTEICLEWKSVMLASL